jgi:hypothetical protein
MKPEVSDSKGPESSRLRQDDYQARTFALADLAANARGDAALTRFSAISQHWGAGITPHKKALKFQHFVGWHARMVVSDLPECGDLRFRIIGDRVMDMFGHRFGPGHRFSDLPHVTFDDYAEYFKAIRAGGAYGRYSGVIPFAGQDHQSFEVLDLPAADEEGQTAFLFSFFYLGRVR